MYETDEEYLRYIKAEYKQDTLTRKQLKRLGFMPHHISNLLPKPESVSNPYFKGQSMNVWKKADVFAAMEREEFQHDGSERYVCSVDAASVRMYRQYERERR